MADIAASDVTYTLIKQREFHGVKQHALSVVFGDGALTYPTGGVPLTKAKLGTPNVIESINIYDPANANGFVYKYDATNEKVRIYQGEYSAGADADLIELAGGVATPAAATLKVEVKGW